MQIDVKVEKLGAGVDAEGDESQGGGTLVGKEGSWGAEVPKEILEVCCLSTAFALGPIRRTLGDSDNII